MIGLYLLSFSLGICVSVCAYLWGEYEYGAIMGIFSFCCLGLCLMELE